MRVELAAACALVLILGCAHASDTGKTADVKDATAPRSSDAAVRSKRVTSKTPPGQPPLAASPSELMQPGSQKKISEALKSKGFADRDDLKGEQLSAALRKFQQSEGLAATGFADHETLLRLGLDPKEVDEPLESMSVSKPSDDTGKGGFGAEGSEKARPPRNATPPKDAPAKE
jgi:peptidoglycan hydrolase-like protein with peptidoglycan-binding domain